MFRSLILVAAFASSLLYSEAFLTHHRVERRSLSPLQHAGHDHNHDHGTHDHNHDHSIHDHNHDHDESDDPPPPPLDEEEIREIENAERRKKVKFRQLVADSVAVSNPEHLPKLLANNIGAIAALQGQEGAAIIKEIVEDAKAEGEEQFNRTVIVIESILSFAESFVEEAESLDSKNKKLLGKIINAMKSSEDAMDELMEVERDNFTAGFLRHIEGECERIGNAPKMTTESTRLIELLRVIQARVLEEIGADMGEATLVLGQLMGYDDRDELLGVLDAGLTVQGREFAVEMKGLTEEALRGFESVHGGVEPELLDRVSFVDQRLTNYLEETNEFQ
ncbi:unnamed protein product [Cylindrotheca closterium]|uniref:Uncharacterized protein n=1 Tax=Cylindrotheca closterium TaxID=2856 RepID=A0AAD2PW25_9STRA|nr:unnamed protein product [Cylindrotheca closterium]